MNIVTRSAVAMLFVASCTAAPAFAAPFPEAASISSEALGAIVGKEDVSMAINARNTAEVSNNSVNGNSVTGGISFDGSSFADLRGLTLLSANTGNNVAINSSLNVNVALRP
jgi:hypothetical protein